MFERNALISVSNRTGIVELAQGLVKKDITILSTGGTRDELIERCKVPVVHVSDYTGFPEILDGRVKTLHPKIHGGILASPDKPGHKHDMAQFGIVEIQIVVVNLYPFEKTAEDREATADDLTKQIDIGGHTLIRAAARIWRQ